MVTFKKSRHYIYLYLGGLILTLGALALWIVLLATSPGSKIGDIVLLSILFFILIGGEALFIGLYLRRPVTVLSFDDENVYVHLSKKKTITYPFSDISSFGKFRHNLVVVTKSGDMRIIRFIKNSHEAEAALKTGLNAFINNHPDRYFTKNLLNDENKDKSNE
ncbi:MAG: hypothetical protein WCY90_01860 [Bacilli bacterium]